MYAHFAAKRKQNKKFGKDLTVNFHLFWSYNWFLVAEGYKLSFLGSTVAGFITSVVSLPVDIAKTRMQNMNVSKRFNLTFVSESCLRL